MSTFSSYGVGQYSASAPNEAHALVADISYNPFTNKRRGIIYLLGAGSLATNDLAGEIGSAFNKFPQLGADMGSTSTQPTWANNTSVSRMTDGFNYLTGTWGAKSDKVGLVGVSHGSLTCLAWAVQNPSKVAFLYLVLPANDVQDIHDNRAAGLASVGLSPANIENAYGGLAGYNAAMPGNNPARNAGPIRGIPSRIIYSSNDPIVDISTVNTLANNIGPNCQLINTGANGHSTNNYYDTEATAFANSNL